MTPFKSPNYTQTPNDLFDEYLPQMSDVELRVVLAVVRNTFGFRRNRARLSLTKLQKMTGLSRQGVLNGAKAAEERGLITRSKDDGITSWLVNVVDQVVNVVDQQTPELVNVVDRHLLKKKDVKKPPTSPDGEGLSEGQKPKSEYVQTMEHLETVFAEIRGCPPPAWTDPKADNKRWRMPLNRMYKSAGGDLALTLIGVRAVTTRMKADGLTFSAPDGIEKSFASWIIDHAGKGGQTIKSQNGGMKL